MNALTLSSPARAAPSLSPEPTVVVESNGHLLMSDGAATRTLTLEGARMKWSVSPDNTWLAARTTADATMWTNMTLHFITVADGVERFTQRLLSSPPSQERANDAIYSVDIAAAATWSSDGPHAVFVSAHDGPSSDLYEFDSATAHVLHLTDSPTQAALPQGSADGKWIVHITVTAFGGGGWNV